MLPTRELTYQDDALDVRLVISAPTVLTAMKRSVYYGRALAYLDALDQANAEAAEEEAATPQLVNNAVEIAAQRLVAQYIYPDVLAASVEAEGLNLDMPVSDFLALPEALTDAWQKVVYELCPDWWPFTTPLQAEAEDVASEAEKKGVPLKSDSASSLSTTTKP